MLDLPETRKVETLDSKNAELNVDGVRITHPNKITSNWFTENEYLHSVLPNNAEEYAHSNSAVKVLKGGRNLLLSDDVNSV